MGWRFCLILFSYYLDCVEKLLLREYPNVLWTCRCRICKKCWWNWEMNIDFACFMDFRQINILLPTECEALDSYMTQIHTFLIANFQRTGLLFASVWNNGSASIPTALEQMKMTARLTCPRGLPDAILWQICKLGRWTWSIFCILLGGIFFFVALCRGCQDKFRKVTSHFHILDHMLLLGVTSMLNHAYCSYRLSMPQMGSSITVEKFSCWFKNVFFFKYYM